jgi:hypothetical protein
VRRSDPSKDLKNKEGINRGSYRPDKPKPCQTRNAIIEKREDSSWEDPQRRDRLLKDAHALRPYGEREAILSKKSTEQIIIADLIDVDGQEKRKAIHDEKPPDYRHSNNATLLHLPFVFNL